MNYHLLSKKFPLFQTMRESREIIPKQLSAYLNSDIMRWFSWGAKDLTFWRDNGSKEIKMASFNVSGYEFKGHVCIFLNASDLFDVYFFKNRSYRQTNTVKDLYFDQLAECLDNYIEKPTKNYK